METTEKNQNWITAKNFFESIIHLSQADMLKQLENSDINNHHSVKEKVLNLIAAMDKNKTLFNQTNSQVIYQNIGRLMDWSGKKINDYQIEELIAVGGMSSIYRAKRLSSEVQKPVAIKVMQPYQNNDSIVTLFKQEQQALSILDHPNIVSFYHGDQTKEGVYYLVMEYISKAKTLDLYIQENKSDVRAVVKLIKQVADAMTYAHSHLVVHKDLKSSNILIDQHGTAKVIDFGIAALNDKSSSSYQKIYTPTIASPEQIKGKQITSGTDIFSLSATLLDLLIEDNPLPEFDPETYQETNDEKYIDKVLQESNIDLDLKRILAKGLQVQLTNRYTSMDALANDLQAWLNKQPLSILNHKISHRVSKAFARNPLGSYALTFLLLALVLGTALVSYYALDAKKQAKNSRISLQFLRDVLSQSDPSQGNDSDITVKRALKITLEQQKNILAKNPETELNIMTHLVDIYIAQSMFHEAAEMAAKIHSSLMISDGPNALITLQWKKILAEELRSAGNYTEAIKISDELINQLDENQIDQANIKLSAMLNIAGLNMATKDFHTRQNYMQKVMKLISLGVVDDDKLIGEAWLMMAILAEQTGDLDLLKTNYQKALYHKERSHGKQHPHYANTLNSYAVSLAKMGYYDQSEPLFLESIELARKYDDKGIVYGRNLLQYATLLFRTQERKKAMQLLQQSTEAIEKSKHSFTLMIAYETSYRFNKQMRNFSDALEASILSTQKAQILFKSDDYPYYKNVMYLSENLVMLGQFNLAKETLALLLKDPKNLESQHLNKAKLHMGLIAWLTNDIDLIKSHHILNQSDTDFNRHTFILDLLNHYPQATHVNANQANIFTNEYDLLVNLLTSDKSTLDDQKCQLPEHIKSKTDLIVLKVILKLCADVTNISQPDIFTATKTAEQIPIKTIQIEQIESILNH